MDSYGFLKDLFLIGANLEQNLSGEFYQYNLSFPVVFISLETARYVSLFSLFRFRFINYFD